MSTQTDEARELERWRCGDEGAGTRLVAAYTGAVHRFFRGKVEQGSEALAQRSIRACVATPPQAKYGGTVRSYLMAIARHVLINHIKEDRGLSQKPDLVGALPLAELQPSAGRAEETAELGVVASALRRLPLDLEIILEIARWEQATPTELAEILEVPEGTVDRRLWRAEIRLEREVEATAADTTMLRRIRDDLDGWIEELGAART